MVRCLALFALTLGLTGCSPTLNVTSNFNLPIANEFAKIIIVPKFTSAQTLKVIVESDANVDMYVITGPNCEGVEDEIAVEWEKKAAVAKKGIQKETFTTTIPAGGETKVIVTPTGRGNKANGTVKLSN